MQIPWQLKSRLFSVADKLPPSLLYSAQKHLTRRSRAPFKSVSGNWQHHFDVAQREGAKRLVEFGAGKSLAQNLYLSLLGVEQTVVDLNPMVDLALVNQAARRLEELGTGLKARELTSLADLSRTYGIQYQAPVDMQKTDFPDGSFDMCMSTDTMEHIPVEVLKGILGELRRVLRPGGVVSAVIDYGDHYSRTDRAITDLNYLRFTDRQWRRHNHGCHYQNRLRHGHYAQLATEAGLSIEYQHADLPLAMPSDARPDLLLGDGADHFVKGYYVLRNP